MPLSYALQADIFKFPLQKIIQLALICYWKEILFRREAYFVKKVLLLLKCGIELQGVHVLIAAKNKSAKCFFCQKEPTWSSE